jgi:hypothetical protein
VIATERRRSPAGTARAEPVAEPAAGEVAEQHAGAERAADQSGRSDRQPTWTGEVEEQVERHEGTGGVDEPTGGEGPDDPGDVAHRAPVVFGDVVVSPARYDSNA